jgi:hypothetical protein
VATARTGGAIKTGGLRAGSFSVSLSFLKTNRSEQTSQKSLRSEDEHEHEGRGRGRSPEIQPPRGSLRQTNCDQTQELAFGGFFLGKEGVAMLCS